VRDRCLVERLGKAHHGPTVAMPEIDDDGGLTAAVNP
jgi:hypothetical protein